MNDAQQRQLPTSGTSKWPQIVISLVGVSIALASLVIGLAIRKREITVIYRGKDSLVKLAQGMEGTFVLKYKDKNVASLTKLSFAVRNSGSVAIRREDVVRPITLRFKEGTPILNAFVERTVPEFPIEALLDGTNVECNFPLLNPGDEAQLAVLVEANDVDLPEVQGRVTDIRRLEFADESRYLGSPLFALWGKLGTPIYTGIRFYNGFLVLMGCLMIPAGLIYFVKLRTWERRYSHAWEEMYRAYVQAQDEQAKAKVLQQYDVPAKPTTNLYTSWVGFFWWNLIMLFVTVFAYLNLRLLAQIPR